MSLEGGLILGEGSSVVLSGSDSNTEATFDWVRGEEGKERCWWMEHGRVSGEGLILGESTVPLHRRRRSVFIDEKKEEGKNLRRNKSLSGDVN